MNDYKKPIIFTGDPGNPVLCDFIIDEELYEKWRKDHSLVPRFVDYPPIPFPKEFPMTEHQYPDTVIDAHNLWISPAQLSPVEIDELVEALRHHQRDIDSISQRVAGLQGDRPPFMPVTYPGILPIHRVNRTALQSIYIDLTDIVGASAEVLSLAKFTEYLFTRLIEGGGAGDRDAYFLAQANASETTFSFVAGCLMESRIETAVRYILENTKHLGIASVHRYITPSVLNNRPVFRIILVPKEVAQ